MTRRRPGVLFVAAWLAVAGVADAAGVAHDLDAYALFASERIRARSLQVTSGDVGVEEGVLESHAPVDAPSSTVAAEVVHLTAASTCAALFATGIDQEAPGCPLLGVFPGPVLGDLSRACGVAEGIPACVSANGVSVGRGETRTLAPGVYGDLRVRGGTVVLQAGQYVFCSIRTSRESRIEAPADADVAVTGTVTVGPGSSVTSTSGRGPAVVVGGGVVSFGRDSRVTARLCAPQAVLFAGDHGTLAGRFAARLVHAGRVTVSGLAVNSTSTTVTSTTSTSTTVASTSTTTSTTTSTRPTTSTSTSTSTTSSSTTSSVVGTLPTTTSSSSSTTTTVAASTSTSSTSTTSSSSSSSTVVQATTTTSTTISTSVCGNHVVEPGETCDDGNTLDGDSCPSNCRIESCTAVPGTARGFTVNVAMPPGAGAAGITVLVDYPEGKVSIPGSGNDATVKSAITNLPSGAFGTPNDLDYAVREVIASFSPIPVGRLFTVTFQDCQGVSPPAASEFTCRVEDAADALGLPVDGVTCSVDAG